MKKSFTLIELIVVIAIIAILAAIIAPNAFKAIEKAKIARVLSTLKAIKTAVGSYYADTGKWPPRYDLLNPGFTTNPFLIDPGISGWDGPYVENWNNHPWGGYYAWYPDYQFELDGISDDALLIADDDQPGTSTTANDAQIPRTAMIRIDEILDDGNLSTGNVRGDPGNAIGSLGILIVHNNTLQ
ncbi:MAG: pilin [Candidatus Omnitrophica bacterium]|nr:pilin [Candidatus Omnitrophota bacterium]MBU2043806.1 pilin [Candidatus Omnitrophota bacterium]MBU2251535.1 pilin [Candidatus Omnitrophota bacterium]